MPSILYLMQSLSALMGNNIGMTVCVSISMAIRMSISMTIGNSVIHQLCFLALHLKLVHCVVLATRLESCLSREVLLVVVPKVGSCHVLVLHTVQPGPDLPPLHLPDIGQHAL